MLLEAIRDALQERLRKKKHDVLKLQWQKAELERKLEQLKREHEGKEGLTV